MFSFRKNKGQSAVVFDINAESVGAAVILSKKGKMPRIVYMCREYFLSGKTAKPDIRRMIDAMQEAFRKTEYFLAKNILSHRIFRSYAPSGAHYAFSAPWTESKIKTMAFAWPEPVVITEKFAEAFIQKEAAAFRKEISIRSGAPISAFVVIESKIVSVRLDGREVKNPYGKKAKTAEISLCLSAVPKEIFDMTSLPAGSGMSRENFYASFSAASVETFAENMPEKDFVILDILEPMTQAFIARKGSLFASMTIPVGENALINAITKNSSLSYAQAQSQIKIFFAGHAEEKSEEAFRQIIVDAEAVWRQAFEGTLDVAKKSIDLPQTFFVLARENKAPFFLRAKAGQEALRLKMRGVSVKHKLVTDDFLKSKLRIDKEISGDPALFILCAYFSSEMRSVKK